jgi:hypothetical protein
MLAFCAAILDHLAMSAQQQLFALKSPVATMTVAQICKGFCLLIFSLKAIAVISFMKEYCCFLLRVRLQVHNFCQAMQMISIWTILQ